MEKNGKPNFMSFFHAEKDKDLNETRCAKNGSVNNQRNPDVMILLKNTPLIPIFKDKTKYRFKIKDKPTLVKLIKI